MIYGRFDGKAFDNEDFRAYVLNRRAFLKQQKRGHISLSEQHVKAVAMEIAKTLMGNKRHGEGDSNPRDDTKQKGWVKELRAEYNSDE